MPAGDLAVVSLTVFATAVLSGVLGMAGGVALLAVLLLYLPPLVAIPVHGVIQLVSNGSRTIVQRAHSRYDVLLWYGLPLVPAGLIGLELAQALPGRALEGAIGAVVLLATWLPRRSGAAPHAAAARPRLRFLALGGCSGFLAPVVGASGVLVDPFFLGLGLSRQALVGTKAACQALGHLVKIGLFGFAGFAFAEHAALMTLGAACAVLGTWVGSRLLDRMDEASFLWLYRSVLTGLALRLLWAAATP